MILKCREKQEIKKIDTILNKLDGFSFVDNVSFIKVLDNEIIGKRINSKGEEFEFIEPLYSYNEIYLLNNEGKTIEKIL